MLFQGYQVKYKFNASHNFSKNPAKKHSHTFCVDLYIQKESTEFVEFVEYENILQEYFDKFRSRFLNEMPDFKGNVPTLECMCKLFYDDIKAILNKNKAFSLVRVEIGDNPISSVSYGEDIVINSSNVFIPIDSFEKYKKIMVGN